MKILIPIEQRSLSGPFVVAESGFEILGSRDKAIALLFREVPDGITWFREFTQLYCQRQHDPETAKVLRELSDEDRRVLRVPAWIQGEDIPVCCGRQMFFVGQIDDDNICVEGPDDAAVWWHDSASFYVFTCPQCMECKAIGQQF